MTVLEDDAKEVGWVVFPIGERERVSTDGTRGKLSGGLRADSPGTAALGRGAVALAAWAAHEDWGVAVHSYDRNRCEIQSVVLRTSLHYIYCII